MSVSDAPVITTKEQLVCALQEVAQLEQEFMCQYLYASFSLKKNPDDTCSPAQFEYVRRWASMSYMIARQEMEHLSIANSLLTAIGAAPTFAHANFPTVAPWFTAEKLATRETTREPCTLPFLLEPFSLETVRRFTCMESPELVHVPAEDRKAIETWCFTADDGQCRCVSPTRQNLLLTPRATRLDVCPAPASVEIGSIEELYAAIHRAFTTLSLELGHAALFSGHLSGQHEIPSEYNIYLFPICNLSTALTGIDIITRQGEGIDAPPGFESHFMIWYQIAEEYRSLLAADPRFEPARRLPSSPTRPEVYDSDPLLAALARAFNTGYVSLLYMLTGYYTNFRQASWQTKPFLSQALEQIAFAPMMTMLVRSLGEIIARIPWQDGFAGPTFFISDEERALLDDPTNEQFASMPFYFDRLSTTVAELEEILQMKELPKELEPKLRFIWQNIYRVRGNLNYIYNNGTFPNFVIDVPPHDGCGVS